MAKFITDQGPLELGRRIDNTNRAEVYELIGNENEVAKIFPLTTPDLPEVERTTHLLLDKGINDDHICLPLRIITDESGNFVGYTMRRVPDEYSSLKKYIRSIDQLFPDWNRKVLVRLAIGLVEKINILHQHGLQIVDVKKLDAMVAEDGSFYLINSDRLVPNTNGSQADDAEITKWLYQILMIGHGPIENFDLPLTDKDRQLPSDQEALSYWSCLPAPIKEAFFNSFKSSRYPSMARWSDLLQGYKSVLEGGRCEIYIKPQNPHPIPNVAGRSVNLNMLDIDDSPENAGLRIMENIFSRNDTGRIGVLELSTKNVKLLVGPSYPITMFNFDDFKRLSYQTQTGQGLDDRNRMNMYFFNSRVLPTIQYYASLARTGAWQDPHTGRISHRPDLMVDRLYVVATAAYRTAENRREILRLIKQEAGVNVCILKKDEEELATMTAFLHTTYDRKSLLSTRNVLIIDQGGGSTEVSPFVAMDQRPAVSINLGTNALLNLLLREQTPILQALSDVDWMIQKRLGDYFVNCSRQQVFGNDDAVFCIAVGSAITEATGKKGNKRQHCTVLTLEDLKHKILMAENFLLDRYEGVSDLIPHINRDDNEYFEQLNKKLTMRLGLPIYVGIMEHFGIKELTVSGTGLWYGIYFQQRPIMLSNE